MKELTLIILIFTLSILEINAQTIESNLTSKLNQIYSSSSINGFGVAIYDGDSILYSKGFGFSDENHRRQYTAHTTQKVASISKVLLGVSIMKAVELGMMDLEDNVNDYLPFILKNPNVKNDTIRIRHLATHTSGINKTKKDLQALYFPTKIDNAHKILPFGLKRMIFGRMVRTLDANEYFTMEEFLGHIYQIDGRWYSKKNFDEYPAGTNHIYSNTGASFLALILEKASGMKYEDFVSTFILTPLQMEATYFDFEVSKRDNVHTSDLFHAGLKIPNDYQLILYPAGGLETNVNDFAKFMSAMIKGYSEGNQIFSVESYQTMMTTQANPIFNQGILWEVYDDFIGHNGDIAGANTFAYFDKRKNIGYVLFSNTAMTPNIDTEMAHIKDCLKAVFDEFQK